MWNSHPGTLAIQETPKFHPLLVLHLVRQHLSSHSVRPGRQQLSASPREESGSLYPSTSQRRNCRQVSTTAMDQNEMLTWREPPMSADHMNYFNANDFGPPTASSGGYYSMEDDQYDYSFPASQNTLEQYNLPPQFGHAATNLSHQVSQALSQQQHQHQLSPTATHAGAGQGLNGHAYFGSHGATAPHAEYDHSSHGDSPVDLTEDQEAALNALRAHGQAGSSDLGSSISVLEVTTAARGQRHERNREKNRLAASKCREKSKKYVDELRERERELAAQRASLSQHAASLREEVLWLKNEILRHGDCNCEFIQNYLATAARQIT
ncbi:Cyclic AMP-responsive element-binding protein 5 [Apiospora arundinis]|uniref:Cyclic AMP-responsive element-binding protein 5 n=1 Tax=Apiospora arundinis TaxID=335852 RepID=A0ABR2J5H1_9PEZI